MRPRRRTGALLGTAAVVSTLLVAPGPAHALTPAAPATVTAATGTAAVGATPAPSRVTLPRFVTRVSTRKPVVFITVDDGIVRDRAFLRLVRERHLPVTVFLTTWYAAEGPHADYFRRLQKAGAVIENHTLSHPDLTRVGTSTLRREICTAARRIEHRFGRAPTLFRPPYGAIDSRVLRTARDCGMTTVGWDAVMPASGGLETWNGHGALHRGDIVLFHFVPGLVPQLERVLAKARRAGLRPALLEDYVRPPR
jgi:peptidoglycan/xylan/chitin deacetylase (PgdA/CDA1 family)